MFTAIFQAWIEIDDENEDFYDPICFATHIKFDNAEGVPQKELIEAIKQSIYTKGVLVACQEIQEFHTIPEEIFENYSIGVELSFIFRGMHVNLTGDSVTRRYDQPI